MDGHFLDGLGKAIGCVILIAFLCGIAAASCVKACPYRVRVERAALRGGE
jgi:hypothetical protein